MAVCLVANTWLTRYNLPIEINYDQVSYFIGHELKNEPIKQECVIKSKLVTLITPQDNSILEHIC